MHKSITSTADIQNIYKFSRQCSLWIRHVSKHSDCMIISGNLLALWWFQRVFKNNISRKFVNNLIYFVILHSKSSYRKFILWCMLLDMTGLTSTFNPLTANLTKWANTLKQVVGYYHKLFEPVWPSCGVESSRVNVFHS